MTGAAEGPADRQRAWQRDCREVERRRSPYHCWYPGDQSLKVPPARERGGHLALGKSHLVDIAVTVHMAESQLESALTTETPTP